MSNLKIIQTQDGSHSLLNAELNETYHSTHGAIRESLHVFIKNGLQFWLQKNEVKNISILEVGFGTGLNALLTLQEAVKCQQVIHYTTVEAFPVTKEIIGQLNYTSQLNFEKADEYFQTIHQREWNLPMAIHSNFILEKRKGKIQDMEFAEAGYDIIYFDAFAPVKQPEMWERPVLEKIVKAMKENAVFVTYCAKGQLKRDLKSLGLQVDTLAGPPGKREMVRANK